jgi:hypothetical protein
VLLVEANFKNNWLPFPREFYGPPKYPRLYGEIGVTILLTILGYLVIVILYSIVYRIIAPSQYGPTDSPPIRRKGKRRSMKQR